MKRLILALKAFFKAFKDPEKARLFIEGETREAKSQEAIDQSHLRLLSMLQQSSRFIDFLKEKIPLIYSTMPKRGAVRKSMTIARNV